MPRRTLLCCCRLNRRRRLLLNTLTAISLLLAILVGWLIVRGTSHRELYFVSHGKTNVEGPITRRSVIFIAGCGSASIAIVSNVQVGAHPEYRPGVSYGRSAPQRYAPLGLLRSIFSTQFGFERIIPGAGVEGPSSGARLQFPLWVLFLFSSLVPAIQTMRWVARRRRTTRTPHCPACGYDMRANPARCSECGHLGAENSMGGDER